MIESKEALRELFQDEEFVKLEERPLLYTGDILLRGRSHQGAELWRYLCHFDRWGDNKQLGQGVQGIYHEGTRFISDTEFRINGYRPLLLSSNIKIENEIFSIDLTNPRIELDEGACWKKALFT